MKRALLLCFLTGVLTPTEELRRVALVFLSCSPGIVMAGGQELDLAGGWAETASKRACAYIEGSIAVEYF